MPYIGTVKYITLSFDREREALHLLFTHCICLQHLLYTHRKLACIQSLSFFYRHNHKHPSYEKMYSSMKALSLIVLSPLSALALPRGNHVASQATTQPHRDLDGAVWKNLGQNSRSKRQSSWNPPSDLVKPLQEVWDHSVETYNNGEWDAFKNYGYDIIVAAEG